MPRIRIATIEEYDLSWRASVEEEIFSEELPVAEPVFVPDVAIADDAAVTAEPAPVRERKPAKSFDYKLVTADEITQDRYNELKNHAMRYKKLKSRISKKFDSLNRGRVQFVKFGLAGRTLKVYLNLELGEVEPKYHCKDQSFKKPYEQVPVLIRVKSGRAVKYAKKLIDECAARIALKQNPKYIPQDYITEIENMYEASKASGEAAVTQAEE